MIHNSKYSDNNTNRYSCNYQYHVINSDPNMKPPQPRTNSPVNINQLI